MMFFCAALLYSVKQLQIAVLTYFALDLVLLPAYSHVLRLFLRDPATYKDPMEFKPERYLGPTPEPDPRTYCFGFGRR